ncbi:MAG: dUTP diphosphatase [Thermoflavifilum sp.]|nr:dUTP diphosphatase [Thermoflavifilum sp.]MCL6513427.1 dUTP diphosphatase [Alicyclobacillus sp.]
MEVLCKVVSPHLLPKEAPLPRYASEGAAGMDLYAAIEQPVELRPGERRRIPTGIALSLPHAGVVALVYARSGLAWRHGIGLPNGVGVIDSDYTGEIEVLLTNFGDAPHVIQPQDRIAQVVFAPVYRARLRLTDALPATARGERGFGSTGR